MTQLRVPGRSHGQKPSPIPSSPFKFEGEHVGGCRLLNGYALNMGRASQGMPRRVQNAKIACLDMNLQKVGPHLTDFLNHSWMSCLLLSVVLRGLWV